MKIMQRSVRSGIPHVTTAHAYCPSTIRNCADHFMYNLCRKLYPEDVVSSEHVSKWSLMS
jgi:hypothetical protein